MDSTSAGLPVGIRLSEPTASEVAAHVEAELGWQVVHPEGPPPPALVLTDAPSGDRDVAVLATVDDGEAVRAALLAGARDVLAWPDERQRLPAVAAALETAPTGPAAPCLTVAGAGGGVGTSTVTLAAAGLLAWSGAEVLAIGPDGLCRLCGSAPWEGPGAAELAVLGPAGVAEELPHIARPVAGMPRLSVLGGGPVPRSVRWPVAAVALDSGALGVGPPEEIPSLIVAAPDSRLAVAADVAAPVLVVGRGPYDARAVRRALGRDPVGWLPHSSRVARAGSAGRVPAGLPGTWLARLRQVLATLEGTRA